MEFSLAPIGVEILALRNTKRDEIASCLAMTDWNG